MSSLWSIPCDSGGTLHGGILPARLKGAPSRFSPYRPHRAYVPAHKDGEKLPVLYLLAPWTQAGRTVLNWEPFKEDIPARMSRLVSQNVIPPCIIVAPDLYIDYGGSQFIDSKWVGDHASHIVYELIPFMEEELPVLKGPEHRGVFGRSSGGFGALRLALDFPGMFSAVGCHAGDMGFEWVYRRSLIDLCTGLVKYKTPVDFMNYLSQQKKLGGWDTHVLMMLGMCAFYSPNLDSPWGFDLPIDLATAEVNDAVFAKWMAHDPVEMINQQRQLDHLGKLKELFIDCGNRDQYLLQYGSRRLSKKLKAGGVAHTYQEFDDNHSGTTYRFDESLPKLVASLI